MLIAFQTDHIRFHNILGKFETHILEKRLGNMEQTLDRHFEIQPNPPSSVSMVCTLNRIEPRRFPHSAISVTVGLDLFSEISSS